MFGLTSDYTPEVLPLDWSYMCQRMLSVRVLTVTIPELPAFPASQQSQGAGVMT